MCVDGRGVDYPSVKFHSIILGASNAQIAYENPSLEITRQSKRELGSLRIRGAVVRKPKAPTKKDEMICSRSCQTPTPQSSIKMKQ